MEKPAGVTIQPSPYAVKETIDRLSTFLQQHGATVYARIDQQDELKKAGQEIPRSNLFCSAIQKQAGKLWPKTRWPHLTCR
jgi:uncharacterized protein (DUF302 family)